VKVLLLSHCFPPAPDGGSITFGYLKRALKKGGIETEVLTSNCFSSDDFVKRSQSLVVPRREEKDGLLINRLPVFRQGRRAFWLMEKILGKGVWSLFAKGPIFKNFGVLFEKREVDWVVAGLFPTLASFWGYWVAKRNGAKFALVPGFHFQDKEHDNPYLFKLLKKVDLIFCFTNWEKKYYRFLGVEKERLVVIGNVVDDFLFEHNLKKVGSFPKTPMVLYLGSKAAHKRVEFLLEAMERVWGENRKVRLTIAGPETLHSQEIKKRIKKLKPSLREKITYLGKVSEKKKISLLDSCMVLVNPSKAESFGLVFVEAWARKKPVIGADLPVLKELIKSGENGWLFKKDSVADLADQILKTISSPKLAVKAGENGYNKVVKKYTFEKVSSKFLRALRKK